MSKVSASVCGVWTAGTWNPCNTSGDHCGLGQASFGVGLLNDGLDGGDGDQEEEKHVDGDGGCHWRINGCKRFKLPSLPSISTNTRCLIEASCYEREVP